jgi:hypothetical protein
MTLPGIALISIISTLLVVLPAGICMYVCTQIYVCLNVFGVCMCVCVYIIYMYVCVCIYIYIVKCIAIPLLFVLRAGMYVHT